MQRRGFLGGILAAFAAPAIIRAESLMPVAPRIWVPFGVTAEALLVRLELADMIYAIAPTETPFLAARATRLQKHCETINRVQGIDNLS